MRNEGWVTTNLVQSGGGGGGGVGSSGNLHTKRGWGLSDFFYFCFIFKQMRSVLSALMVRGCDPVKG